ncbi:MAG: S-layer homology domain-containing protein [Clostridia bacterium]|nr:S-layer homology domain-containing protein [Clostridia bacterium]
MINKKSIKILVYVLIGIMLFSGATVSANTSNDSEEAKFFDDLGIIRSYTDGEYRGNDLVTRGEFCSYIVRCIGQSNYVANEVLPFDDVKNGSEGYNSIGYLYKKGVISYADSFRPDDIISSNEAIKLLVCALGYEQQADILGGFPIGYVKAARTLGIGYISATQLTKNNAAKLLYNAVNVRMATYGFGDGKFTYSGGDEKDTWLYQYLGLERKRGFVTKSMLESLTVSDDFSDSFITIDNENYTTELAGINDYFGCYVTFHTGTEETGESGVIKSIYTDSKVIRINSENLVDYDYSRITYSNETGRDITKKIDSNAYILYNGLPNNNPDASDFPTENDGYVILTDNNGDNVADVVSVWKFTFRIVNAYSNISEQMIFKDGTVIKYNDNKMQTYDKTFNILNPESISENNVLSIAETKNKEKIIFVLSDNVITGSVSSVSDDETVINGVRYKIDKSLKSRINSSSAGTFYLDFLGKVVDYNVQISDKYGYIFNIFKNEDTDEWVLKAFTDSNKTELFTLKDRVTLEQDGVETRKINSDDLRSCFLNSDGSFKQQLVRLKVRSDNCISKIVTAFEYSDYSYSGGNYLKNWGETDRFILNGKSSGKTRYYMGNIFNSGADKDHCSYWVDSTQTKVFYISDNEKNCMYGNLFDSTIKSTDSMSLPTIKVYGVDEFGYAETVVFESTTKINATYALGQSSDYLAVTDVSTEYDETLEEVVTVVNGYNKAGAYESYKFEDSELTNTGSATISTEKEGTVKASEIKPGDVLLYTINGKNIITDYMIVFRQSEFSEFKYLAGIYHPYVFCGYLGKAGNRAFTIVSKDGEMIRSTPWPSKNVLVTMYNTKTGKLEKAEKTDIYPNCRVCIVGGVNANFIYISIVE